MADTTAEDTTVPTESIDTSTTDDTQVTDTEDIDLEDIEVTEEEALGDETDEESEDEEAATDESDDEESDDDEASDNTSQNDSESEDEEESQADDTADDTKSDDDEKERNRKYAEQRIAERESRERERQVELAKEDVRLEQYLQAAQDDEVEYVKRQAEVQQRLMQRERVGMNRERLEVGIDKAVASIDLFRTGTPEVKQELADAIDDFLSMNVVTDQFGDPIEVRGDIAQFLQKRADSIRRIQGVGARSEVKKRSQAKARTVAPPSKTPKQPKVDEDLKDFDDGWE